MDMRMNERAVGRLMRVTKVKGLPDVGDIDQDLGHDTKT